MPLHMLSSKPTLQIYSYFLSCIYHLIVRSVLPEIRYLPSGVKARQKTLPVCPSSVALTRPLLRYHSLQGQIRNNSGECSSYSCALQMLVTPKHFAWKKLQLDPWLQVIMAYMSNSKHSSRKRDKCMQIASRPIMIYLAHITLLHIRRWQVQETTRGRKTTRICTLWLFPLLSRA